MSNLTDFISSGKANALVHTDGVTKMQVATDGLSIEAFIEMTCTDNITGFFTSDEELKSEMRPIQDCLGKVDQLRTVDYIKEGVEYRETGLIAQDVNKVIDNLVYKNDKGNLVIRQGGMELIALAFGAIKELKAEVEELKRGK